MLPHKLHTVCTHLVCLCQSVYVHVRASYFVWAADYADRVSYSPP